VSRFWKDINMIAYKVTRKGRSIFAPPGWRRVYKIGRVVNMPVGTLGLFCFYTRERAHVFQRYLSENNPHRDYEVISIEVGKEDILSPDTEQLGIVGVMDSDIENSKRFRAFYHEQGITSRTSWDGFTASRLTVLSIVS
jgi:hypothetical protein